MESYTMTSSIIPISVVILPLFLGQLSLLPSVGRENEYRPRAVTFCGWGGNGRLWKRCGLPSITPGASPLPAQDHETEMSTAPWRRIVCVCNYADQWVNLPFFIAVIQFLRYKEVIVIEFRSARAGAWVKKCRCHFSVDIGLGSRTAMRLQNSGNGSV